MSFAAKITKHWKLCGLLGTSVGAYFGFPLIKVYGQANTPNAFNSHESTQLGSSLMKSYQTILHQHNKSVKDFFVSKQYIFYGQSVIRCFRAGFGFSFILSDYIWTYYIHIPYLKSKHPDIDTEQIESRCHDRSSRLLCRVLLKNMGIYVKTGQTIANMTYLFPPEYIQNMKPCLYSTLISPPRDIQYIIERDLHQKIDELFESFDMEPIASASLGQVHRATLKTGEEVAVKIQHRGLLETAPLDMWFIKAIVKTISVVFPKINYNWFAEEMSRNLPVELDFLNEVQNMEICRKMIEPYKHITVPKVHSHLCSSRCLVMSFEEGVQIDKVDPAQEMPSSFYEATDEFISLYLDMVFKHHYLHADPHGGNVLVRTINNNTELVLLDHGLYHHIAPDFLVLYSQFISSIAMNDLDQTRSLLTEILRIGMTMNQDPKMIKRFKAIQLDDNLLDIFMTVLGDKNINGQSIDYSIEERTQLQKLIFSNLEAVCIYVSMLPVDMGFFIKTFDCIRTILYPFNLTTKFFMNLYLDCQKFLTFNDLQQHSSITNYIKSAFYHVYYYIFSVVMSFVA